MCRESLRSYPVYGVTTVGAGVAVGAGGGAGGAGGAEGTSADAWGGASSAEYTAYGVVVSITMLFTLYYSRTLLVASLPWMEDGVQSLWLEEPRD